LDLKSKVREIMDFPKEGIDFKDITTLLKDGKAFKFAIKQLAEQVKNKQIDVIAGPEARGFLIGAPLAYELNVGFVPARKPGKLPGDVIRAEYKLEYGTDALEMHKDSVSPGENVLIVDDLLATGGTIMSTVELVKKQGGIIQGIAFLIELTSLNGRKALEGFDVFSIIKY
jgi:adenine phosphoribosyltransferase